MISHVHGIVFLSTPHRGSSHANSLNNLLSVMIGTSNKGYVAELDSNSTSIEDLNEQFRSVSSPLRLASMYETLPTRVSPGIKKMIVGKDTGILNYPREISGPADADHHTVCKYRSRFDDNYILFITFLKQISRDLVPPGAVQERVQTLESIFGIVESPMEDLEKFTSQGLQGTGEWLRGRKSFEHWLSNPSGEVRLFCLTGMPGTGKSTLAAMTIRHLQQTFLDQSCQYHFFTESQPTKKSLAYCLRSIAFQIATTHSAFAERLVRLHQDVGDALSSQKYQTIWAKVFQGILFKIDIGYTLHWVFDGVDEAENPQMLLKLVSQINSSSCIKIMLLSRPNKDIIAAVGQGAKAAILDTITSRDTAQDIREYVCSAVTSTIPHDSHIQAQVIDQIVSRTEGSFLWARLALETLHQNWHTLGDIQKAMDVIPKGMQSLYQSMLLAIRIQDQRLQDMAQRILTWATCSFRPMKLAELQAALEPEFGGFISLKNTIIQICGHFIRIDGDSVSLIHATARRFLITPDGDDPGFVSSQDGHEALAKACLQYLSDDRWRRVFSQVPEIEMVHTDRLAILYDAHPLLSYALNYWAYHVRHAPGTSLPLLQHLKLFFSKHVLCWIQAVTLSRSLRTLPLAAQYLKLYLKKRKEGLPSSMKSTSLASGLSGNSEVYFLECWVVDLTRILGKFGNNLAENPSSIFKQIPPFCPRDSIIGQFGGRQENTLIKVTGISSRIWDDNLARLSVDRDETASKVRCTGVYFLTLVSSNGTVTIWSAETCEVLRRLEHGEWVVLMETNATGSTVATSGRFTFKIWDISSGQLLRTIARGALTQPVQIAFGVVETDLVVAYDDCSVVWYSIESGTEVERFIAEEATKLRGCPRLMALSPDQSRVAIAFRGRPVLLWDTSNNSLNPPRRCLRAADEIRSSESDAYNAPEVVVWHPDGDSLCVLYQDTVLAYWNLIEDERSEFDHTDAREMVMSSDGTLLLTCNFSGVLSVWALPKFNLIYRLHGNDFVRDMAFSPDSRRIYDTRGPMCCVWEPDALVRPDDIDRHGDSLSSTMDGSLVSEAVSEPVYSQDSGGTNVTALTYESGGDFYCCGREDGTVSIHDMKKGKISRKVCSHGPNVEVVSLAWSPSGRFIVSGDDMGKIIVKKLRLKDDGKWAVFPVFETRISDRTADQFLFSGDEQLLLISAPLQDQIWDLGTKSMICEKSRQEERSGQWITHPFDETRLLLVEQNRIHIHKWRDLEDELLHNIITTTMEDDIETPRPSSATSSEKVQALVGTNNHRYLVCQTSPEYRMIRSRGNRDRNLLSLLLATDLQGPASTPQEQVRRWPLSDLSSHIQSFLGCLRDKLVFIDYGNWSSTIGGKNMPSNIGVSVTDYVPLNRLWFICPKRIHIRIGNGRLLDTREFARIQAWLARTKGCGARMWGALVARLEECSSSRFEDTTQQLNPPPKCPHPPPPPPTPPPHFFLNLPTTSPPPPPPPSTPPWGFTPVPAWTDPSTSVFLLPAPNQNICLMLHTQVRFTQFIRPGSAVADARASQQTLFSIGCRDREGVDAWLERVEKAGGKRDSYVMEGFGVGEGMIKGAGLGYGVRARWLSGGRSLKQCCVWVVVSWTPS
ncbi:hypothetical protein CHGG_09361 [Chaetomium globosum CBS 148.51]|uniref:NACHT domain-containing protein n=1 Tax=Chaetomium globosum (strain ATCC 6205 / CBS 148.51 / DSM 1962 / NBRC 6347 / NRRL 1970) TaxID=306901 RepID=Q2GRP3_CHAGB|nr:uncharacterized protein CHGG_09361 [Chaetomium globosum CBS 148.51]EAQ85347.1 hypothetical protein CHGG_09361 [Chaetomium globosum CBS 148.51]